MVDEKALGLSDRDEENDTLGEDEVDLPRRPFIRVSQFGIRNYVQ